IEPIRGEQVLRAVRRRRGGLRCAPDEQLRLAAAVGELALRGSGGRRWRTLGREHEGQGTSDEVHGVYSSVTISTSSGGRKRILSTASRTQRPTAGSFSPTGVAAANDP